MPHSAKLVFLLIFISEKISHLSSLFIILSMMVVSSVYFTREFSPYMGLQSWVHGVNRQGLRTQPLFCVLNILKIILTVQIHTVKWNGVKPELHQSCLKKNFQELELVYRNFIGTV